MSSTAWKPKRNRLADQVAERLKERVLTATYEAGCRLPSERELAQEFGITRLTVREALKVTEESGFTETRHGAGTFVRDLWQNATLRVLGEILNVGHPLGSDQIRALLEFRRVVTAGFAAAIAKNRGPSNVTRLLEIVQRERGQENDVDTLMTLDYEFHQELANASGNLIYALLMRSIRPAYLHLSKLVFSSVSSHQPIIEAHEAIARAVESGEPERIRDEITNFVVCGNAIIETCLENTG